MITSKNLVHHEFIGLKVHATNEKNKSLNLYGTIIDETKNTIKIESIILVFPYYRHDFCLRYRKLVTSSHE